MIDDVDFEKSIFLMPICVKLLYSLNIERSFSKQM